MKPFAQKSIQLFFCLIIFSIILPGNVKANSYTVSTGYLTIDEAFTAGGLGGIITSIQPDFSEIRTLKIDVDNLLTNEDVFWIRDSLTNLVILNCVQAKFENDSLPENAFRNHQNLRDANCTFAIRIGKNAFRDCTALSVAYLVNSTYIGDSVFAGCNMLWRLQPNFITPPQIGTGVFYSCNYYRQVRLSFDGRFNYQDDDDGDISDNYWHGFELLVPHENHIKIEHTFTTGQLSKIVSSFRKDLLEITELTITTGVLNSTDIYWIRDSLPNLVFLNIIDNATFTGGGLPDNAFKDHKNLQIAQILNATSIGDYAFDGCLKLCSVKATSATSIGNYTFRDCHKCIQLYLNNYTPPTVGLGTFNGCDAPGKIIDLDNQSSPAAYRAVNDGNKYDNYWYGWEIESSGTIIIRVNTDEGGNLDWGTPAVWDTIYENVNGAMFWNGLNWTVNETYGHMYFEDMRIGGYRIGRYGGINYLIEPEPTNGLVKIIWEYTISVEEYSYSVAAIDSGTYTYTGLLYKIDQPDGTSIHLYSRGNGTDSVYFDVVLEDTGPGITTFREGGVVSDASNYLIEEAADAPFVDSLAMGRLVTKSLEDNSNMYYIDTNGGSEMGGMSYIMATHFLPPSLTVEHYDSLNTYISDFRVHFTNGQGELESFYLEPFLISEEYTPPVILSTDASLSSLQYNGNPVTGFNPDVFEYNTTLPYGESEIPEVIGIPVDENANAVATQATSLPGTATVLVTAEDGITQLTYTVEFTIALNDEATLSDILIDEEPLTGFDPETLAYSIKLPYGTTEIPIVDATPTDGNANVNITQAPELPGITSILVTAANGETQQTYTVEFTIALNNDATLSEIIINEESLTGFNTETLAYSIEFPYGTTEIPVVAATPTDNNATVNITQASDIPGSATIVVTAEDGVTQQTYTVEFSIALNDDATLSYIIIDEESLTGFDPETLAYSIEFPYGTTEILVVAANPTDGNATVNIIQASDIPGSATIVVTAEDGVTQQTYTVEFTIALNDDATLRDILINGESLTGFDPETLAYSIELPYGTTEIPVVAANPTDGNATVNIIQALDIPGSATIVVTAENGKTQITYMVEFSIALNNDASLNSISINDENLAGFIKTTLDYFVGLPYGATELPEISANPSDPDATVEINQAETLPGTTTILVTAANGQTQLIYTISFSIASNDDASLINILINGSSLPGFNPNILDYVYELPYGTTQVPDVSANAADVDATVEITQTTVLPGTSTILVTAADGETQQSYTVEFTIAPNNDATLSSILIDGETLSDFSSDDLIYLVELPYGTSEIPVVGATSTDNDATVEITQATGLPGTATVVVTAEDGVMQQTYAINFSVAANNDASLSSLQYNGNPVPDFNPDVFEYNVVLPYGETAIPEVIGGPTDENANTEATQATSLPGTATVVVTAEDGVTQQSYAINFSVAANNDASLSNIQIDENPFNDFNPTTFDYLVELPSETTIIPVVTANPTDDHATVEITQAATLPGTASIIVTAEDGTTRQNYNIQFTLLTGTASMVASAGELEIYPNPGSKILYLKFPGITASKYTILVNDIKGRTIISKSHYSKNYLDVSEFVTGIYYIIVENNGKLYYSCFIKTTD